MSDVLKHIERNELAATQTADLSRLRLIVRHLATIAREQHERAEAETLRHHHIHPVCKALSERAEKADEAVFMAQGAQRNAEGLLKECEAENARLREALGRVLNYFEPDCQTEECDKGWHVERLHAWKNAKAALRGVQEKPDAR